MEDANYQDQDQRLTSTDITRCYCDAYWLPRLTRRVLNKNVCDQNERQ